jgi:hypothetical protein
MKVYAGSATVESDGKVTPGVGGAPTIVYTEGASVEVRDVGETTTTPPGSGPRLLRTLDLGKTGPYVVSVELADTGEASTYNRKDTLVMFVEQKPVVWSWRFAMGMAPATLPRMRMLNAGVEISPWRAADEDGIYRFPVNLANGHHLAHVEVENTPVRCIGVPYLVNDTGAPLPVQAPWTATKRFDAELGCGAVQVQRSAMSPPVPTAPLKPRTTEHYSERIRLDQAWGRHCTTNTYRPMNREWVMAPGTNDFLISPTQKYFHTTALDNHAVPRRSPLLALYDGPRGVGTLGYVCDLRIRSGGQSAYFLETSGRLGRLRFSDGDILTEVGPVIKPGERAVHSDVFESSNMFYHSPHWDEFQEDYHKKWLHFGDWSQVTGPKTFWEPWGFAVAMRLADGSILARDGHEFWICDTRHNRILFVDHWTAHALAAFQKAHFPPAWYVQAEGPTGTSTVCDFVGSVDGTPTDACNEPWQCKVRKQDGMLYWTNFKGDSIFRCRLDGTGIEPVLVSSLRPTDAELTVKSRLAQSKDEPSVIAAKWVVDGPVGRASCVRPMAFDFDSDGNLVFIERYSYMIRRLDFAAMTVKSLCQLLAKNGGSSSSGNNEPVLVIDSEGTCGPKDDIFTQAWSNGTNRRFDKQGNAVEWAGAGPGRSALFTRGGNGDAPNGPADYLTAPGYAWGIDVYDGKIIGAGNAAGSQFIEISKRKPDEPNFDLYRWRRGIDAFNASGVGPLLHGSSGGQGTLGFPTWESMVSWTDEQVNAEMRSVGVPEESLADVLYCVRWVGQEHVAA